MWMRNVNDNENVIDISSAYNVVPGLKTNRLRKNQKKLRIIRFLSRGPHYMRCLCQWHSHCHSHFSFTFLIYISHWFLSWMDISVYTLLQKIQNKRVKKENRRLKNKKQSTADVFLQLKCNKQCTSDIFRGWNA